MTDRRAQDPNGVHMKARILIVDDHPVVRHGLARLLGEAPDLEICGEAETVADALRLAADLRPELVIVDLSLREGHGLDLIKRLAAWDDAPRLLVVSMHEGVAYAERALRAGAHGYVAKCDAVDEIVEAARQVLHGASYLGRRTASGLIGTLVGRRVRTGGAPEDVLSDRELQVFELLGRGMTTREIGEQLQLSVRTIDTHRERLKDKLGLRNASELMMRAFLWCHERRS